ncbi:MAG: DNA nickase, partial [Nostoc sp. C3-bin3]|nr:DNA nickase [Nostoc sp. C3-bin3]
MVATLDDTKRNAIAIKLASLKALQQLVIENEQSLLSQGLDAEIADRIRNFLNDDEKNLGVLETVIGQYGIQAEPKNTVTQ